MAPIDPCIDERLVNEAREYFKSEFPECKTEDFYDFDSDSQVFRILHKGSKNPLVKISQEFFSDMGEKLIRSRLKGYRLAERMQEIKSGRIIVTTQGLRLEPEK